VRHSEQNVPEQVRGDLVARKLPLTFAVFAVLLTAVSTSAQRTGSTSSGSIIVRVSGDDGQPLDVGAEVRVYPGGGGGGGAIFGMSGSGGRATFNGLTQGEYTIEASAQGYKTGSGGSVNVEGQNMTYEVDVRLERDTSNDKPVYTGGPILAPKAQKAEDKGVAALRAGKYPEAQKDLEETLKLAPANPNANSLLGYIFLQEKNYDQAETYLMKAYSLDPKQEQTLVALGQLRFQQGNYAKAVEFLTATVTQDPSQFFAHWVLADAHLRQREFEDARREAQLAVQTGKGAANAALFIEGEALASLERNVEAIQTLELFLKDEPHNSAVPKAQALLASLKGGGALPAQAATEVTPPPVAPAPPLAP
jgi:Flp pilus assembly protein TadD